MPKRAQVTVGDLIAALKSVDPKTIVIMSRDTEGNGHSPFSGYSEGKFLVTGRRGEYSEEDNAPGVACVCLWPE